MKGYNMKKLFKSVTAVLLLAMILFASACGENKEMTLDTTSDASESDIARTGLWENAIYTKETELGSGSKEFHLVVEAENQSVTFTIHTDADTVGAALLEHGLIAGEETELGLMVKTVNGITADYNVDRSYWAFYINGEYAMTGVDGTEIKAGDAYRLVYTR